MNCELCQFNNPKGSVTGIIIKNNQLLILKREGKPFKGLWDLPGGYMNADETPLEAINREMKEELGIISQDTILMNMIPGVGIWKEKSFPIINFFYLIDVGNQNFKLNEENSAYKWISISQIEPENIVWDSNSKFIIWLKQNFTFNLQRIKELISQLDPNSIVKEQSLYKAILSGHISKLYNNEGKLVGLGWIYPRQTLLRKQAIIEDMIVDETYRGLGFGKIILQQLINWAKKEKIEVIELTTNPKRIAAHKLYESEGFTIHPTDHMLLKL